MLVLRDPNQLPDGLNSPITALIISVLAEALRKHFQALSDEGIYDPEEHGYIVIAEPGDDVKTLEAETGCPILTDWFHETHYGDEDYSPAFEWLDNRVLCYEMGFILNDSGYAMLLVIPKLSGIDAQLLAMCRENAYEKID
ncbi:MAG: hypothetical protein ACXW0T_10625 [Methylobacter sp.]